MEQEIDRRRTWGYVLVALTGLLLGMALGQMAAVRGPYRPRVEWPAPSPTPPHPRSLSP